MVIICDILHPSFIVACQLHQDIQLSLQGLGLKWQSKNIWFSLKTWRRSYLQPFYTTLSELKAWTSLHILNTAQSTIRGTWRYEDGAVSNHSLLFVDCWLFVCCRSLIPSPNYLPNLTHRTINNTWHLKIWRWSYLEPFSTPPELIQAITGANKVLPRPQQLRRCEQIAK